MKLLILLESSEDDGGANAQVVVGAKMAASAADRRESLAMVDLCVQNMCVNVKLSKKRIALHKMCG